MNHQVNFTRTNAMQWINVRYDPYTKGMHKTQFPNMKPNFWQCGVESSKAHVFNDLVSANFLDPTQFINVVTEDNNDDVIEVTLNTSAHREYCKKL